MFNIKVGVRTSNSKLPVKINGLKVAELASLATSSFQGRDGTDLLILKARLNGNLPISYPALNPSKTERNSISIRVD